MILDLFTVNNKSQLIVMIFSQTENQLVITILPALATSWPHPGWPRPALAASWPHPGWPRPA